MNGRAFFRVIRSCLVFALAMGPMSRAFADDFDSDLSAIDSRLQSEAQAGCSQTCAQASQALEAHRNPCSGHLPEDVFCPHSDRLVVNPFGVLQHTNLPEVCRYYLLLRAQRTATESLNTRTPPSADERRVLQLAGRGPSLTGSCRSSQIAPAAGALLDASAAAAETVDRQAAGPQNNQTYCHRVASPCTVMGGEERMVRSYSGGPTSETAETQGPERLACVSNGMVIDPSCNANHAKVRAAIESVRGHGVSCMSGIGGDAAAAGERLRQHLSGDPATAICCGECTNHLFPEGGSVGGAGGRTSGNGPHGTIKLAASTLAGSADRVKATLFHEFLHRMGLCTNADHDLWANLSSSHNFLVPPARGALGTPRCPANYVRAGNVDCDHVQLDEHGVQIGGTTEECRRRYDSTLAEIGRVHPPPGWVTAEALSAARTDGMVCVRASSCSNSNGSLNQLAWANNAQAVTDPVYGCESACYSSTAAAYALSASDVASARRVCQRLANRDRNWSGQSHCCAGDNCPLADPP